MARGLALLLLILAAGSPALGEGEDPSPSALLAAEAGLRAASGDLAGARAYLDEALALDGREPSALRLSALLRLRQGDSLLLALAELDAALASPGLASRERPELLLLSADLLRRLGRPAEALSRLDPAPSGALLDPRYYLTRALSFSALGERRLFVRELDRGLDRFPRDPAFARAFLERLPPAPPLDEERALADRVLGLLPLLAEVDPGLRPLAVAIMPSPEARRDAILAFREMGGSSREATLRALEYGLLAETRAVDEAFSGRYALELGFIRALSGLLSTREGLAALRARLEAYSGEILADRDGDGVAEESSRFASGRPLAWSADLDRDGQREASATLSAGLAAARYSRSSGGSRLEARLEPLPFCAELSLRADGEAERRFEFPARAFRLDLLVLETLAPRASSSVLIPVAGSAGPPAAAAAAAAALRVVEDRGDGRFRVTELDAGTPLRSVAYREGRVFSVLDWVRGFPALEKVDLDGDGRFETLRRHDPAGRGDDASVVSLSVDADGDGIAEYAEDTVFPFRKSWDLDGDGAFDARQEAGAEGTTILEFSSRLDGRFDERLTLRGATVLALTRDGKPLALVQDANPALRWIGTKPFDLGRNLPAREGVYRYMNRRYRLVYAGTDAFAELLP